MTEPVDSPSRPGVGQWLLFFVLAAWLAVVPLIVMAVFSALTHSPPDLLVQLELVSPGQSLLPSWVVGLLSTAVSLGLQLLVFVPLLFVTRRPDFKFLNTTALLLVAIVLFQALTALARLPWPGGDSISPSSAPAATAALQLALILPFLLFGLGWIEARHHDRSLLMAWRRVGLRLWFNTSALWLALGAGAIIIGPWVLVGSLGSTGTTAANLLQALPDALGEEILFRGVAFAWLWRSLAVSSSVPQRAGGRTWAAAGSMLLFVAAQGGTVLPYGDWGALLRFASALWLGLLVMELTVRAGGSIWPAVVVHFLYNWFRFAFADPRSTEELLHWLVMVWAPLAAGGIGLLLWLGRKVAGLARSPSLSSTGHRVGVFAAAGFAITVWVSVLLLYLTLGVPGFHPDGFLVFMEDQADLGSSASIADPAARREWAYHTLVDTAENSQASIRDELDRRGVHYRPHYLVNSIEVLERPGLRRSIAREPGVASVLFQPGVRRYPHSFALPASDWGSDGVEWSVREVGADQVWDLGYTGQGIIVGDADTGVAWDHPVLKEAYLGWDGVTADHNYHWYDAWDGATEPVDKNGHGTHTTGTVVGFDQENQVGLAPGARWIACRNMRHGIGNPGSYVTCMEFLLAPFPLDGDPFLDGDPAQGAHVVNNSWGCPTREGCLPDTLRLAVQNLRAAGQMMVVSAGNSGPSCSTVQDVPATYDAVFSVGAVEQGGLIAGFSSRGPVTVDGSQLPKPDIVAPGVNIRSSVPGGYASMPGTSMAGPHVAGAVALLWSADPDLIGELDRTEEILTRTSELLVVDAACSNGTGDWTTICGCGSDQPGSTPNNVYGWGRVDVWAAVQSLLGEP